MTMEEKRILLKLYQNKWGAAVPNTRQCKRLVRKGYLEMKREGIWWNANRNLYYLTNKGLRKAMKLADKTDDVEVNRDWRKKKLCA